MTRNLMRWLVGVLIAGSVQVTSATVFDFTPSALGKTAGSAYESVNMTVDGIRVDITAFTIVNDGSGSITNMTQITGTDVGVYVSSSENLGVYLGGNDGHDMDGGSSSSSTDLDEGLMFVFDQQVTFNFINFDSFGSSDDFNLTVDDRLIVADFGNNSTDPYVYALPGDSFSFEAITGTRFLFWADGASDDFRVDRLEVTAVPAPNALLLLGLGLAGIFFTRKKNSSV